MLQPIQVFLWSLHTLFGSQPLDPAHTQEKETETLLLLKEVAETTIVINRYFRCFKMLEAMLITGFSLDFYSLILALTVDLACSNYYSTVLMRIL